MQFSKHLSRFSDDDVYTMLYLYHLKGVSLEALKRRFAISQRELEGYLEGRCRSDCYESFKVVEQVLQGAD